MSDCVTKNLIALQALQALLDLLDHQVLKVHPGLQVHLGFQDHLGFRLQNRLNHFYFQKNYHVNANDCGNSLNFHCHGYVNGCDYQKQIHFLDHENSMHFRWSQSRLHHYLH